MKTVKRKKWRKLVDIAWPVTYIFYSSRQRRLATTSRRGWRWLEKAWIFSSLVRRGTRASLVTSRTYHFQRDSIPASAILPRVTTVNITLYTRGEQVRMIGSLSEHDPNEGKRRVLKRRNARNGHTRPTGISSTSYRLRCSSLGRTYAIDIGKYSPDTRLTVAARSRRSPT